MYHIAYIMSHSQYPRPFQLPSSQGQDGHLGLAAGRGAGEAPRGDSILRYIILYYIILCYNMLYYIILYYIVVYYIILYYSIV